MCALYIITFLFIIPTVLGGDGETQDNTGTDDIIRLHQNDTDFLSTAIAPPWVASPNTRGTGDILLSCLLTMVACIYTAIHPKIPTWEGRPLRGMLMKTLWHKFGLLKVKITMAWETLIAPEAVLITAIRERRLVKALQRDLKEKVRERSEESKTKPNEDMITMDFCYFAVMGGFRVSITDIRPSESTYFRSSYKGALPEDLALSPDGIRLLAQLGHLNLLLSHASDVEDKNKSNGFQKLLVMVQLSWMVLQCIVRKTQNLPISLLEIHTFVHATFAVLLYIAWFSKPADISRPVYIPTDAFADALALMVQEQFCEAQNIMTCLYPQRTPENESSMLAVRADPETMPPSDEKGFPRLKPFIDSEGKMRKVTWIEPTDHFSELCLNGDEADGIVLPCGMSYAKMFSLPVKYRRLASVRRAHAVRFMTFARRRIFFSPADKIRAARVIRHITLLDNRTIQDPEPYVNCAKVIPNQRRCRYPDRLYRTAFYHDPWVTTSIPPESPPDFDRETTTTYAHNRGARRSDYVMDINRSIPLTGSMFINTVNDWFSMHFEGCDRLTRFDASCVTIFSFLNGGIHLAAWNSVFPTQFERTLWNVSSMIIITIIPVYYLNSFLASKIGPEELRMCVESGKLLIPSNMKIRWYLRTSCQHVANVFFSVMAGALCAARLYLIMESFISLQHMPYGVFIMPSWLEVLPHL